LATGSILKVAVNAPLRRLFDYLPPKAGELPAPGVRVRVPFGGTRQVGVVVALAESSDVPAGRLRRAEEVLDREPLFGAGELSLLNWAARYYAHPVGEVFAAAMPVLARKGRSLDARSLAVGATESADEAAVERLERRAPKQAAILRRLLAGPIPLESAGEALGDGWRPAFRRLADKSLVEQFECTAPGIDASQLEAEPGPDLTPSQQMAVDTILAGGPEPSPVLLFGVTGSGKTEVYLRAIDSVLEQGRQALVLVPEIGLTPQIVRRFRRRFACPVAVLHSGLSEKSRFDAWADARSGRARVVIGTRSAVFTPMADCGLIAVDEEHDPSFKQQEGFRYSARDVAVVRGHMGRIPVVLGSATPSLESMRNADIGRYRRADLVERPGATSHPRVRVVDLRTTPAREGLTAPLLEAMQRHLGAGGQVILFLNRRGYATALFCTECGWVAECPRCDARMTLHQHPVGLRCHHCGRAEPVPATCGTCGAGVRPAGQGTERIEIALGAQFPGINVARLDRDTARSGEALATLLDDMRCGATRILIGTQMLTKGHDFPDVTLVGILNCDQGLFGTDFRSDERLAQTILQVSGRAGRRHRQGEVFLQTAYPQHPLLGHLVRGGYGAFSSEALRERSEAGWPPYSHLALIRAEAHGRAEPLGFLELCRDVATRAAASTVSVLGPAPAPMERRSGRYRAQLLLKATHRPSLQALIDSLVTSVEATPEARRVRWSLDVDPVELF
jgi:primosomal protein N' (replication factor Y)